MNNKKKSFQWVSGDTLIFVVDPLQKQLIVKSVKLQKKKTIDFDFVNNQPLHPIIMFYYQDD